MLLEIFHKNKINICHNDLPHARTSYLKVAQQQQVSTIIAFLVTLLVVCTDFCQGGVFLEGVKSGMQAVSFSILWEYCYL